MVNINPKDKIFKNKIQKGIILNADEKIKKYKNKMQKGII